MTSTVGVQDPAHVSMQHQPHPEHSSAAWSTLWQRCWANSAVPSPGATVGMRAFVPQTQKMPSSRRVGASSHRARGGTGSLAKLPVALGWMS